MPNYFYKALDSGGHHMAGRIVADDERAAVAQVKGMGLFPVLVRAGREDRAADASADAGSPSLVGGVGSGELTVFSRQLANLVAGGLPLMRTFAALTEHTESPRLRSVMLRMQQDVQGGKALWESMSAHTKVFPPLYVSMVKAGEASGQLSEVLQWLADYLEREQTRRLQIRSALAYPTLLVTVGVISVFLLVTLVVPRFVVIFEEFDQALPMPTVIMLGVSGFLTRWWWLIIGSLALIVIGFREYGRSPRGRLVVDGWRIKIPLFGKLGLKSAVSRFARTTATLLKGGVPLLDSMVVVREVVGNEVLARGADAVREGMREGESFAQRLKDTGVFPPLLTHMVGVGEETGDLQGTLLTVANSYDVEVDASLKSLVSLLEPLIIITVGGTIAFIIMAMLLPVFQLNLAAG
ncbi:MAG: type II secretion system F family protein [Armatimonadetes bacterium]|nr:type II secretion system F family protein [Armatimonadota bacterium]